MYCVKSVHSRSVLQCATTIVDMYRALEMSVYLSFSHCHTTYCTWMDALVHTEGHTHKHAYTHTYERTHTCTHKHTHTHTHMHTHTHTHTHTHSRSSSNSSLSPHSTRHSMSALVLMPMGNGTCHSVISEQTITSPAFSHLTIPREMILDGSDNEGVSLHLWLCQF